jgi:hypothetical protein
MVVSGAFEGDLSGGDNGGSASVTEAPGAMCLRSLAALLTPKSFPQKEKCLITPPSSFDQAGLVGEN